MDLDLWNLSGVESLNMVGRLVQVYFQGKAGSTIGVVYTIDPETKSLVLLTNFDLIKKSPENVTFIPGGSVESVKLLAAPSPDQIPMPPFVGMDQHKKEMKTVVGLSTGTSSTCSPSIRSATPSVCGDFVYDSDCRDGLQKSFKTMFCPPCPASEEVMMSTGSTMKRNLNEARNIFNEYCIIRRQRIVKALRSKNITFQEQDAGLSIAHHVMSSPSSGNQQQTEEAQAMDTTADSSCNNRQIVIGPLKILPPFGEGDIVCSNPAVKKKILNILKGEGVFDLDSLGEILT